MRSKKEKKTQDNSGPTPVADLLAKYRDKVYVAGSAGREQVAETIRDVIGVSVDEKNVSIKGGTAYLTLHPAIKASVWARKREILRRLAQEKGIKHITDIS